MRKVIMYKGEAGFWVVEVPSLPGCVTQGRTVEEALANAREAIECHITALQKSNETVPPETPGLVIAEA